MLNNRSQFYEKYFTRYYKKSSQFYNNNGLLAWALRYGRINQTTDLFINSSQEIQLINKQTTYTGAVSEIQNQHNKTPKYTIETSIRKEYATIKERIEAGIHPVNIGKKSTFVSADKVLIKGSFGRYLIEVGETTVNTLGFAVRTDDRRVARLKNLMNKMYDLDLKYQESN